MSLMHWDSFRDLMSLRDAMDRMMEDFWRRPLPRLAWQSVPLDVIEDANGYTVKVELPGVRPEDVSVTASGSTITIQGEFGEQPNPSQASSNGATEPPQHEYHVRERRFGRFYRSLTLPSDARLDEAEATYEHGVLTLSIPKAEEARPRQIPIRSQRALEGSASASS